MSNVGNLLDRANTRLALETERFTDALAWW
jgi:hypothetical protein